MASVYNGSNDAVTDQSYNVSKRLLTDPIGINGVCWGFLSVKKIAESFPEFHKRSVNGTIDALEKIKKIVLKVACERWV